MRALVIGESHTVAIADAVEQNPEKYRGIIVRRLARKRQSETDTLPLGEAIRIVGAVRPEVPVFLAMVGTFHNMFGLLNTGADYDFLLGPDASAEAEQDMTLVPHRAIASAFEGHLANATSLRKIRAAARSAVYLLSTPPPKQSNDYMLQKFMRQENRQYRGRGFEAGLSRPGIRLKLWKLEMRLMAKWAEQEQMHFVAAPTKALNEDGFLARKYYHNDATHANARYGALILDQICGYLAQARKKEKVSA